MTRQQKIRQESLSQESEKAKGTSSASLRSVQRTSSTETTVISTNTTSPANTSTKSSGEILRELRLAKKGKIEQISKALYIDSRYLNAIEEMDADTLPEQVYTLGFVRSYALWLGEDAQIHVNQFKSEVFESVVSTEKLALPGPIKEFSMPTPRVLFLSAIALAVLFIGGYSFTALQNRSLESEANPSLNTLSQPSDTVTYGELSELQHRGDEETTVVNLGSDAETVQVEESAVLSEHTLSELESDGGISIDKKTTFAQGVAASDEKTFVFNFTETTWLEIRNDAGRIIISKNFEPKETYSIETGEGITFKTGNAGGFTVQHDGSTFTAGSRGQVISTTTLDSSAFKEISN